MSHDAPGGVVSYLDAGKGAGFWPWLKSWIFTVDHKRIGILYLVTIMSFFAIGVLLGITMRLELIAPGKTIIGPDTYNSLFTVHGVIMIFLFIIPGLPAIFGNFFLPIQIGARDVFFPRINLLSWYCYVVGAILAVVSLFAGGGAPDTGWTFYVPYAVRTTTNVTVAVFAAFVLGFSSILTGLNFVTTVHRMRTKGMTWFRMPLNVWSLYATAWIQLLATPIIAVTLILVMLERMFNLGLFDPARGGDPILYQHLFWIYSHPAVYIMILPAMGVVSEIIPTFSHKTIFGYRAIAMSSLAIAFLGYLVWGHHMFTSGMGDTSRWIFSLLTFLVAIPSAIKVFNWVATLYKGSVQMEPALLFVFGFIFLFSIGGLTGMMQSALAVNIHVHDTYFIVGHFHYVMFGGTGFGLIAAVLYWFPKMFGRMIPRKPLYIGFGFMFVGFNLLYFTMLILGWQGMPRRYYDYVPEFTTGHVIATVGSWILVAGLLIVAHTVLKAVIKGEPAPADPWGGTTLEWKIPSPPPHENFVELPVIEAGPYHRPGGKTP
jgi:cytochrome c oxidase subunit 1